MNIPKHPKIVKICLASDSYNFGDLVVSSSTMPPLLILGKHYNMDKITFFGMPWTMYQKTFRQLLFFMWLNFRYKWLPKFLDYHLSDYLWYRQWVGGYWTLYRVTQQDWSWIKPFWERGYNSGLGRKAIYEIDYDTKQIIYTEKVIQHHDNENRD